MTNQVYSSLGTGGTVQAAAADAVLNNHILSLTNAPSFDTRTIESAKLVAASGETVGAITITPTLTASSDYSYVIGQYLNGVLKTVQISAITAASGASLGSLCNELRAQLAAMSSQLKVTLNAANSVTVVITAIAGNPIISVKQISLTTTSGVSTVSAASSGANAVGTYAALIAAGVSATTPIISGQSYTQLVVTARSAGAAEVAGNVLSSRVVSVSLINEAATNFAALNTRLGEIINGFGAGVTTADPKSIAL